MKKYHFLTSWRHHKDFRYDDYAICLNCPKQNEDLSEQRRLELMKRREISNCEDCYLPVGRQATIRQIGEQGEYTKNAKPT